jgi:prephenate dehydrogenase
MFQMTAISTDPRLWNVGLVGYGEVGRILAEDLRKQNLKVAVYDTKLRSDQTGSALRDHAAAHGVALTASHADLAAQADFIVSAVTASQAVPVAQACAPAVKPGAWFLDFNSASPGAKQRAADLIDGSGGRYVEGAVMTSIPPKVHQGAPVVWRQRRRDSRAAAGRVRLRRQGGKPAIGRRFGGEDVPQRDDQGSGSDGNRELYDRARLWRRGCGAGVA